MPPDKMVDLVRRTFPSSWLERKQVHLHTACIKDLSCISQSTTTPKLEGM